MMDIKDIRRLSPEEINKIPLQDRILAVIKGVQEQDIIEDCEGSYFGHEICFKDFCIAINSSQLCVFKANNAGYWAPNFIEIHRTVNEKVFDEFVALLQSRIVNSFLKRAEDLCKIISQ